MTGLKDFLRNNARWLSAGMLLTCLSSFGQTFFIAIFAADIQAAFGLSHGAWGSIYAVGTTASAIVMVWAGQLADVFRARTLGALSLLALAAACIAMAVNPWLWALPLVIFALRLTGQGMMGHIAAVAMSRWFVATRGKALAIAALGFSFGQAFFPIVVVLLMTALDWHWIWIICAGIAVAGVPLLLTLLGQERTPAAIAKSTVNAGLHNKSWTRKEVLLHPLFWMMFPALLGPSAFNTAFFFYQVHYAEIKGISDLQLVSYFPIYTAVAVAGMLVSGALLDRFGTHRLAPLHQTPMIGAFVMFAIASSSSELTLGFIFLGLTSGAVATVMAAFWSDFYGTQYIGAIKALAAGVMVLGSAIGPGLIGVLLDLGVPLETQYIGVALYFAVATLCMWLGIRAQRAYLPRRK